MITNENIKVSEVWLTGLNGEDLGIMPTKEALSLAKKHKVDLVCTTLMSSPPPCRLIRAGEARQEAQQSRKREKEPKLKEIRLTPHIEDHDYDTKKQQAERILSGGDAVLLVVRIQGKEGERAKALLETLVKDLHASGRKKNGIQVSGKQAAVQLDPL
ncbi:translation initiation factor IF-3 [Paenibacillus allorhizosphaerae]|uniref:Translation initiation factor IF-3 n=1 Tax=Paenibacillus allorhizosphaerae TaxID=2849866 RepID=A0ABM8VDI2_9BACL|nr:translation initiation factor IF-3 [Paenibacillus allorhizosphaerae]CAG7627837.1 Translation initiation factor IF-3 [Paenibacillus allorhizosphaerae]